MSGVQPFTSSVLSSAPALIEQLHEDVLVEIFSRLHLYSLNQCNLVCKNWHRLVNGERVCKLPEGAEYSLLLKKHWQELYPLETHEQDLIPQHRLKWLLTSPCQLFKHDYFQVWETHAFLWIPKDLTMRRFLQLCNWQTVKGGSITVEDEILEQYGDTPIKKSQYIEIANDYPSFCYNTSYQGIKQAVTKCPGYEFPDLLVALIFYTVFNPNYLEEDCMPKRTFVKELIESENAPQPICVGLCEAVDGSMDVYVEASITDMRQADPNIGVLPQCRLG